MESESKSKWETPLKAEVYPKVSSLSSSSSFSIRAPLTIDSDSEDFLSSSNGKKISTSSSYGSDYSGGYLTGDEDDNEVVGPVVHSSSVVDEFNDVSRPVVKYPDDEMSEDSSFSDEFAGSRPFGTDPDDEIVVESSVVEEIDVRGSFVKKLSGKYLERSNVVEELVANRPIVKVLDEEEIGEEGGNVDEFEVSLPVIRNLDEEVVEKRSLVEPVVTDVGSLSTPKVGIPIAVLSGYSDDDSIGSEVEDDIFMSRVRVPSPEVVETAIFVPKVKALTLDEVEDDEMQLEDPVSDEDVNGVLKSDEGKGIAEEDSVTGVNMNGIIDFDEEKGMEENASIKDFNIAEVVKNEGLEFHEVAADECVGESNSYEKCLVEVELTSKKGLDMHDSVSQDNTLEPVNSLDSNSEVEVDYKDQSEFLENLNVDGEISVSHDNAMDVDSLSHCITLDHAPSLSSSSGYELKLDDTDGADYSEILPEEAESSLSNDKAEIFICGDPETEVQISERPIGTHDYDIGIKVDDNDEAHYAPEMLSKEVKSTLLDDKADGLIFGESKTMVEILGELEQKFKSTQSGEGSSHSETEEVGFVSQSEGKVLLDSTALAALLKGMTSSGGVISTFPIVRPTPNANSDHLFTPSELLAEDDSKEIVSEEEEEKNLERLQEMRVKFLRLVQRLGLSTEDSIASQVLGSLVLASGRFSSQPFNLESTIRAVKEVEAEGKNELNFSLNILVIGKTGVGKSATINSIFGQSKALTNAFHPATTTVKEIVGEINGVKVRIFDTPGLRSSLSDESFNAKILLSIKKFTKKIPFDVLLYVDRLDTQSRDLSDLPLIRKITSSLGPKVWHNSVIALTHAASTLPDGLFGAPLSFEVLVSQRSRAIQHLISYAIGDLNLLNRVVPVENHPLCKRNGADQMVLPDGQSWIPQLLLLCCSTKILSEANSLMKASQPLDHSKLIGHRKNMLPLPYFVTSLLQSFSHPKLDSLDSDMELGCLTDVDQEDEDEYDQLPPFKPLSKTEISKLSKELKKAYFDEFDYRLKLKRTVEMKRSKEMEKKGKDGADMDKDVDQEQEITADVDEPLADMAIPLSFDGDNPSYRYRFLDPSSHLLTRPVLNSQGWDHDIGYDSVSLQQILEISNSFPAEISIQLTKDKKEFSLNMDSAISAKHGVDLKKSTMAGVDIRTMGDQLAYIIKSETKMKTFKTNETAAGLSITFLGENLVPGFKIEDRVAVGRRMILTGSTGVTHSQGENAYGVKLEGQFREKDFPIGTDQNSFGLTLVQWRGDLIWVCNFQSEFSVGRSSKMCLNAGLNNKGNGKLSVRINSSEQLKVAIFGLLPIANAIFRNVFPQFSERYLKI